MSDLFHAYVIGGARESARAHVALLLEKGGDITSSEHVTFSIDNARALKEWQMLTAAANSRKVYVVYTDFITREAENALLKTLEEPSPRTHIIIAIPKPELLLPTLLSRVRVVMPDQLKNESASAHAFLKLSLAERLAAVGKMIEKGDSDDASAILRDKALGFIAGLEKELSKNIKINAQKLEHILELKKYLYIPGSSVRMILECISLTI